MKRVEGEVVEGIMQARIALPKSRKALQDAELVADEDLNSKLTARLTWIPKTPQSRQLQVRSDPVVVYDARHAVGFEQLGAVVCGLCFGHGSRFPSATPALPQTAGSNMVTDGEVAYRNGMGEGISWREQDRSQR